VRPAPSLAVAAALVAQLAAAGCGLGEGDTVEPVTLTVTRDYGAERELARSLDDVNESDTVMRVLDRSAEVETRYGGGFVHSINGTEGERRGSRLHDWFFYVNGIESSVGAADYPLRGGERIWWDHRDWTAAMHVPAVVGSFPEPFRNGYRGADEGATAVICRTAAALCERVTRILRRAGARIGQSADPAIRVLVGPWAALRRDPGVALLERGPQQSGVFAQFLPTALGPRLYGLTAEAIPGRRFGPAAGLVAATRRYEEPPVWVLTGVAESGVRAAVAALSPAGLRDRYAVASVGGLLIPLPLR
jgi:Domain of unknown function (DUF4430)